VDHTIKHSEWPNSRTSRPLRCALSSLPGRWKAPAHLAALLASCLFTLTACGGGSGSGGTDTLTSAESNEHAAVDDTVTAAQNEPVVIPVLQNDQLQGDPPYTLTIATLPANGTASVEVDKSIVYVPHANFAGTDQLTYVISDSNGDVAAAAVTIQVGCPSCPDLDITVTWDHMPEALGYYVYYGSSPSTVTALVGETPIPVYSINMGRDYGLTGGETVCFSIKSYNDTCVSEPPTPACGVI
jgi:hypothetical protein